MVLNNKKYVLTKKGWIILSVITVILTSILIYSIFNKEKIVFESYIVKQTTNQKLSNAFRNKEITTDEYVLYSAYSLYDYDKLNEKYKSDTDYDMPPDLHTLIKNYENEISEATKEYVNEKIQLKNVILSPENNETSYSNSKVIPVANSSDVEHRLDKYVLSSNGKVVVFYTTKDGVDKTTDEVAKSIANNIESYINKYSEEYDIEFKWEKSYLNYYTEEKYKTLLQKFSTTDAEKMFNALPIYISASTNTKSDNDEEGNILAYYQAVEPNKNFKDQGQINKYNPLTGIPVGPYINIVSTAIEDIESLNSVVAHELFHHYQKYICGEGTYSYCENNVNGDPLFIMETTANWASSKITEKSKIMSGYTQSFLNNYYETIDDINPYLTLNFLKEYENSVENGKQKILNGLLKKYHNGDTLKYLYDEANGNIPVIMRNMSKNIIIGNYEEKNFNGYDAINVNSTCKIQNEKCEFNYISNVESSIKPVATEYLHVNNMNNKFKISNTSKNDTSYITIFSLSNYKSVTVYNVTSETYVERKVIYSKKFMDDIIIDLSKVDADSILISITNGHLTDTMNYKIEETKEEQNIEFNTEIDDDDKKEEKDDNKKPNQVYNIYVDGDKKDINNFELKSRAFVDINELCKHINCKVNYTDDNNKKISITRDFKLSSNTYKYTLVNEIDKKVFDSNIKVGDVNFELSQLDVDVASCPEGKDGNGYDIPKCDKNAFYVPIRFVSQALGYSVEWDESKNQIDINSGLQDKLIEDNNIKIVLSKEKIDIGSEVTDIIEVKSSMTLDTNSTYYAYAIDKDNKRIYNSGFSLMFGNENDFKVVNELDINNNQKTTYSTLTTSNNKSNATIAIVTRVTISSEEGDSKGGIYPIINEVKISIK